jgi:hypothetical protein
VREAAILGTSGGAASRWATDGGILPGTSDDDAHEADGQAVTALPKRTDVGRYGGRARRGRLWRWPPREAWVAVWRPSTTNSSDPVASTMSFDLAASRSSSGDELSDLCLCHR